MDVLLSFKGFERKNNINKLVWFLAAVNSNVLLHCACCFIIERLNNDGLWWGAYVLLRAI
jgi:hypothetical protein